MCKSIELTGLNHYLGATVVTPVTPAVKSLERVWIEPNVIRQFAPCTLIISSSFVMAHELDVPIYFGIMCNFVSILVSSSGEQSTSFSIEASIRFC